MNKKTYVSHDHGEMDYDAEKRAEVEGDRREAERSCENCHTACRGHVLDPSTFVCNNWNPKQPREEKDDSKNSCLYVGGDCDRLKEKDEDIADLRAELDEQKRVALENGELAIKRGLEVKRLTDENAELKRKLELFKELHDAASGLCYGTDWNKGSHAIVHGYRAKLIAAVGKLEGGKP